MDHYGLMSLSLSVFLILQGSVPRFVIPFFVQIGKMYFSDMDFASPISRN
jgi:hypothetical protein